MNGEQFEAHPVWQSLAGLQSEIEQDFEPTNQEERDAVRRLHAVPSSSTRCETSTLP